MDIYLLVDLIVVSLLLILGLSVLLKNNRIALNRVFASFVVCVSVWIIANYISNDVNQSVETATVANYFVFSFSFLAAFFIMKFSALIADDAKLLAISRNIFFVIMIGIITFSAASPLVVKGVEPQGPVYAVIFGPLIALYGLILISMLVFAVLVLRRNKNQALGERRNRIRVIYKSLYLTMPLLLLVQFILPVATGWFGLTNIGIFTMLIVVYGFYYGVVRHRLFDLRLVIVRALAYVIVLAIIISVYGLGSYEISNQISKIIKNSFAINALNAGLIIIIALSYQPLKRYFDKFTNKLFYRDAYDPQILLDSLNKILVTNIDLTELLSRVADAINENIKSHYVSFMVRETSYSEPRYSEPMNSIIEEEDAKLLRKEIALIKRRVISIDEIAEASSELFETMAKYKISVIARLMTTMKYETEGVGYIVFGDKKSGNPYNAADLRTIRIIASELVIAIQNALRFEEIEKFNVTLQQKIDDATKELQKTNEKLKALDEAKDDFISMASHQLRTPLTSIKGYISMILEGDAGDINEQQRSFLNQAFTSSQRMVYLIADLLNVSRLKTGKFIIEASPAYLPELVETEISQLYETAAARGLELRFTKPDSFTMLSLDETKIRQVVMNFTDNAIYYTPKGGTIDVALKETNESVELTVTDTGIGVPKAEQHHLFTKFYRAGNARRARPDGTGLGLFMAKKVIVAQGGSIIFRSTEGKGSTFGFTLPKAKLAVPVADEQSAIDK